MLPSAIICSSLVGTLYKLILTLFTPQNHKVPGEIKRSRDLEEGGGAGPSHHKVPGEIKRSRDLEEGGGAGPSS